MIQLIGSGRPKFEVWPNRRSKLNSGRPKLEFCSSREKFDAWPRSKEIEIGSIAQMKFKNKLYHLFLVTSLWLLKVALPLRKIHRQKWKMFCMFVSLDIVYEDVGRREKKRFVRRVISDGRDMLPFCRFAHTTQGHCTSKREWKSYLFACLFLCLCSNCSVVVLLCLLRFQVLNTGVVKTREMRRVKYVVFFSALYSSKRVFDKLNFVVHFIQVWL